MKLVVKAWLAVLPVLLVLDAAWLMGIARGFYKSQIGYLLSPAPRWWAAALFYPLYAAGLAVFVVAPAVRAGSPGRAGLLGAFFGLVAYAAYDLTNLATVKDWPIFVTVVDMGWGAFVSAAACFAAAWAVFRWA
jgi:uncharacterized membrane protein